MTVLKLMLKLAVLPLYLLLILVRWTGIFLTTFSSVSYTHLTLPTIA